MLPVDIRRRIRSDFGAESADDIETKLEEFRTRFIEVYNDDPSPRIFRCLLHLAQGDEASLRRHSEIALTDWRDLILWAEYDKNENRVFNGNRRFAIPE